MPADPIAAPRSEPARPLLPWLAAGLLLGALTPDLLAAAGWPWSAAAGWWGVGVPAAAAALALHRQPLASRLLLALAAACAGSALAAQARPPDADGGRLLAIEGEIASVAWSGGFGSGLAVRVERAVPAGPAPARIFVTGPADAVLRPGDRIAARGAWDVDRRGDRLRAVAIELVQPREHGPRAAAWRTLARLERRPELGASLLIGQGRPPERDDFRTSGLTHVLAVSGMHLALAAALGAWLMAALGVPWGWRLGMLAALVSGYAWLTGGSPATVRALAMVLAVTACAAAARMPHRLGPLALAAVALVLWRPATAGDAGFQLSVAAVAGICTLGIDLVHLRERVLPLAPWPLDRPAWRGALWCARAACDGLLIGIAAALATLPLVAWWFQVVNPWGAIATLIASPPATGALWLGLPWLAADAAWPGGPWDGLRWAVDGCLDALARVATWTAAWPAAALPAHAPPPIVLLLWPLLFLPVAGPGAALRRLGVLAALLWLWLG